MGDLFDGYGSTLAPRKTASGVPPFDEMFEAPEHAGDGGASRAAYKELHQALARLTQEELRGRTESLASSYLAQGVTFDFDTSAASYTRVPSALPKCALGLEKPMWLHCTSTSVWVGSSL